MAVSLNYSTIIGISIVLLLYTLPLTILMIDDGAVDLQRHPVSFTVHVIGTYATIILCGWIAGWIMKNRVSFPFRCFIVFVSSIIGLFISTYTSALLVSLLHLVYREYG